MQLDSLRHARHRRGSDGKDSLQPHGNASDDYVVERRPSPDQAAHSTARDYTRPGGCVLSGGLGAGWRLDPALTREHPGRSPSPVTPAGWPQEIDETGFGCCSLAGVSTAACSIHKNGWQRRCRRSESGPLQVICAVQRVQPTVFDRMEIAAHLRSELLNVPERCTTPRHCWVAAGQDSGQDSHGVSRAAWTRSQFTSRYQLSRCRGS